MTGQVAPLVPELHRFETLDSTNTRARALAAEGAREGTVVVARTQTAGRGRGTNAWHSPRGGIYLSALLAPNDGRHVTDLMFLGGVAACETIEAFLPPGTPVTVKWPNDCLVDGKKACGILGEAAGERLAVLGIGLNVNTSPQDLERILAAHFPPTSLRVASGMGLPLDEERILQRLLDRLFAAHARYRADGFAWVLNRWERHCAMIGRGVELAVGACYTDAKGTHTEPAAVRGTCLGIDEQGALVLSPSPGERRHYHAGELTCYSR